MFFQEITFITEFPGSNFLLPTIQTGSKWDFQVENLLLLILNPEFAATITCVFKLDFHSNLLREQATEKLGDIFVSTKKLEKSYTSFYQANMANE